MRREDYRPSRIAESLDPSGRTARRAFQHEIRRIDGKLGAQQNGFVKATFELPDALVRQVKLQALRDGRKFKDAVADLLRKG